MQNPTIQALRVATLKQNQFFDLFFESKNVISDMHEGRLSFRVPIVGKLTSIFAGPSKKKLAINVLKKRGWNGSWQRFKCPKSASAKTCYIIMRPEMSKINEIANLCVPNSDTNTGVGLSFLTSPYNEHFEVLSISLPITSS